VGEHLATLFDIVEIAKMQDAQNAPVKYASVNGAWPENLPPLGDQEAIKLVRRLYRKFMGRKCTVPIRITTGNRLTWHRGDRFDVNPNRTKNGNIDQGWPDIVHLLSHYVHGRKFPHHKPHDGRGTHAFIERSMIEHVVNSGWLEGKLKREPRPKKPPLTAEELTDARIENLADCIKRWESKRRRAETALVKLNRQRRRLERSKAA
jgi:hypothetical protein